MDLGLSKGMEPPLATPMIHHTHNDTATNPCPLTAQNLKSTTTKTQIATYMSRSSKPRPKSVMLLLHKSKPKSI